MALVGDVDRRCLTLRLITDDVSQSHRADGRTRVILLFCDMFCCVLSDGCRRNGDSRTNGLEVLEDAFLKTPSCLAYIETKGNVNNMRSITSVKNVEGGKGMLESVGLAKSL